LAFKDYGNKNLDSSTFLRRADGISAKQDKRFFEEFTIFCRFIAHQLPLKGYNRNLE